MNSELNWACSSLDAVLGSGWPATPGELQSFLDMCGYRYAENKTLSYSRVFSPKNLPGESEHNQSTPKKLYLLQKMDCNKRLDLFYSMLFFPVYYFHIYSEWHASAYHTLPLLVDFYVHSSFCCQKTVTYILHSFRIINKIFIVWNCNPTSLAQ